MRFIGIAGVLYGEALLAMAVPIEEETAAALGEAFAGYVHKALARRAAIEAQANSAREQNDAVSFLERLYSLEDPRPA